MEIVTMGKVTVPARRENLDDLYEARKGKRAADDVRLTVQQRDCIVEVAEVPDDCPVLIGQIALEMLDFVIDRVGRKLIGNPDHGRERMIDMF